MVDFLQNMELALEKKFQSKQIKFVLVCSINLSPAIPKIDTSHHICVPWLTVPSVHPPYKHHTCSTEQIMETHRTEQIMSITSEHTSSQFLQEEIHEAKKDNS